MKLIVVIIVLSASYTIYICSYVVLQYKYMR